jgi:hypothetical protein
MLPQDLTTAKTVAMISVVSNTAGEKKRAVLFGRDDARQLAGELTGICDLLADHPVTAGHMAGGAGRRVAGADPAAPQPFPRRSAHGRSGNGHGGRITASFSRGSPHGP